MNATTNIEEIIEKAAELRQKEKFEEALDLLETLYQTYPNIREVKNALIETLFTYGGYLNDELILEYEKARELFERIIRMDPTNYRAYYNLGIANFNLTNIEKAKECYEVAIKIKPDYKHCFYNIGLIYEEEGNLQEALNYYEKALEIDPRFPYAFNARVQILKNLEALKKSQKISDQQEKIEKLKSLLEVSKRIKIEMIQSLLDVNSDRLLEILIEWCKKYQFELDGDFLNLNKDSIPKLIKDIENLEI